MEKDSQKRNLAFYLSALQKNLPKILLSPHSVEWLKKISGSIPLDITNTFGFEYDLNINRGLSGFAFAIPCKKEYKMNFLNFVENYSEIYGSRRYNVWRILKKISRDWIDRSSLLYPNLLGIWLEFDLSEDLGDFFPNVFLGPIRSEEVLPDFISLLEKSKETIQNVMTYIKWLPNSCQIFHIGRMFARRDSGIRLVAKGFGKENLLMYLKKIGWQEDEGFIKLVKEIPQNVNRILINFEINGNVNPHIGIEFSFKPDKFHRENRWNKFLEWLNEKGLVEFEVIRSILDFPGLDKIKRGRYYQYLIVRYIGHIKIVYVDMEKYMIKSYLGVRVYHLPKLLKTHPFMY